MTKFKEWSRMQQLGTILGVAISIITICSAGLAWAGLRLPAPAWKSEVVKVAEESKQAIEAVKEQVDAEAEKSRKKTLGDAVKINQIYEQLQEREVEDLEDALRKRKIEVDQIKRAEGEHAVPTFYIEEQLKLEDEIKKQVKELDDIRLEQIQLQMQILNIE